MVFELRYHGLQVVTKNSNLIEKHEEKNCKIIKTQWFLSILFTSLLLFNKLKQAAVVMGQIVTYVKRYDQLRFHFAMGNFIEKKANNTVEL